MTIVTLYPHVVISLRVCVLIASSYKDTRPVGSELTPVTSFYHPVSKRGHMCGAGGQASTPGFSGGVVQPVTITIIMFLIKANKISWRRKILLYGHRALEQGDS